VSDPQGDVEIALDQPVVGHDIASACPSDQLCVIVQWTALHRLRSPHYTAAPPRVPPGTPEHRPVYKEPKEVVEPFRLDSRLEEPP
jgi:hypothetical protein